MKKIKWFTLLLLCSAILMSAADLTTTIMARLKHTVFNETNPIYLMTGSLWSLIILNLLYISLITFFFFEFYRITPSPFIRYVFVFLLLLSTLTQFSLAAGNYEYYKTPVEVIDPQGLGEAAEMPKEERVEIYVEKHINPMLRVLLGISVLFILWLLIEKENGFKIVRG